MAIRWLGATEEGNFVGEGGSSFPTPGLNVLEDRGPRPDPETRKRIGERLLEARALRARPGLDDKRLTSWNALMISALAEAGGAYLDAAVTCAEFVLRDLRTPEGRLLRTYSSGKAKLDAYLEDYAFLLEAFVALFEANLRRALADPRHGARRGVDRAFRGRRERRFLLDRGRRRTVDRQAQGARGLADPGRRLERRDGPAAPGPADGRATLRARTAQARSSFCTRSPSGTPQPSATYCRRCTGAWPQCARSRVPCHPDLVTRERLQFRQINRVAGAVIVTGWFQLENVIVPLSEPPLASCSG